MTKPTQDKETLREAVARAICMVFYGEEIRDALLISPLERSECFDSADAAIATMFERLRTPSEGMIEAGDGIIYALNQVPQPEPQSGFVFQAMLTAFQQENRDA